MKHKYFLIPFFLMILLSSCAAITSMFGGNSQSIVDADLSQTYTYQAVEVGDSIVNHIFNDTIPVDLLNFSFFTAPDVVLVYDGGDCEPQFEAAYTTHTCRFEKPELPFEFTTVGEIDVTVIRFSYQGKAATVYEKRIE